MARLLAIYRFGISTLDGEPDVATGEGNKQSAQRIALTLSCWLFVPIVLCAPFVLMLHHDTGMRRAANAILAGRIHALHAQAADLANLHTVRTRLLERQPLVDLLQQYASQDARILGVLGSLPDGVQLLSLKTTADRVSMNMRCADASTELAVLERLAQGGFGKLRITTRDHEHGTIERITVDATASKDGAK